MTVFTLPHFYIGRWFVVCDDVLPSICSWIGLQRRLGLVDVEPRLLRHKAECLPCSSPGDEHCGAYMPQSKAYFAQNSKFNT